MTSDNVNKSKFLDALDDWAQVNAALGALSDLIGGCGQANMPHPSMLWHLLALIEKESSAAQRRLQDKVGDPS